MVDVKAFASDLAHDLEGLPLVDTDSGRKAVVDAAQKRLLDPVTIDLSSMVRARVLESQDLPRPPYIKPRETDLAVRFGLSVHDLQCDLVRDPWNPDPNSPPVRVVRIYARMVNHDTGTVDPFHFQQVFPSQVKPADAIRAALVAFCAHEIDESIRRDGSPVRDPHGRIGNDIEAEIRI